MAQRVFSTFCSFRVGRIRTAKPGSARTIAHDQRIEGNLSRARRSSSSRLHAHYLRLLRCGTSPVLRSSGLSCVLRGRPGFQKRRRPRHTNRISQVGAMLADPPARAPAPCRITAGEVWRRSGYRQREVLATALLGRCRRRRGCRRRRLAPWLPTTLLRCLGSLGSLRTPWLSTALLRHGHALLLQLLGLARLPELLDLGLGQVFVLGADHPENGRRGALATRDRALRAGASPKHEEPLGASLGAWLLGRRHRARRRRLSGPEREPEPR